MIKGRSVHHTGMRLSFICAFVFLICFVTNSWSAQDPQLEKIVKASGIPPERLSLIVFSDQKDENTFALNVEIQRVPASLTKIVTAAAALEKFPPSHQFQTALKSSAEIQKGALKGDLILVGDGDCSFVSESMWVLVNDFLRSDVQRIKGDIIVDDSKFDKVRFDPSRDQKRVDRAYDAPIGAMTFNWSAVNIYIRPGKNTGDAAQVILDPENAYFKLVNKTKTVSGRKNSIDFKISKIENDKNGKLSPIESIEVTGDYGIKLDEKVYYRAVEDPALWAGYNLAAFLQRRGIQLDGQVKLGRASLAARSIVIFKSKPIAQIVADMMKFSNNFVAEILTKNLAALDGSSQASMDDGVRSLKSYLESAGLKGFVLQNPSGLSRENKFSVKQLLSVLNRARKNFVTFPEYLVAFPIGGVDGTLKSRMKGLNDLGRVRAKTGLLTGTVGLAGYVGTDSDTKTFAFLYNGEAGEADKAKQLFDRLSIELTK